MNDFKFKKKYGQNFLQNQEIIAKIIDSIKPNLGDLILEIGPGDGALTKELKKLNTQIIAFEIDKDAKLYLEKLNDAKTEIIYEDFLTADIKNYLAKKEYKNLFIVGNLPYYITTPIINRIIELQLNEKSLTIMVQKEVGERFIAHPHQKEYGYMTVILNYWYKIEKIVDVSRNNFYPCPNVDSMVIKLIRKTTPSINYENFIKITKSAFQFKRKNIKNNLKLYNKEKLENILIKHNKSLLDRAEDLDLDTFIDLSENL